MRVLRKPELFFKIGLSDVTIWRLEREGRFPKRIQLGGNSVGWLSSEVQNWMKTRPRGELKQSTNFMKRC